MTHSPDLRATQLLKPAKQPFLNLQPLDAWLPILGLVFITAALLLVGAGGILQKGFPALALAVGFVLYQRHPLMYVSYTCWLWVLTPFVRRVADLQGGYQEPSPMLLAPYLVAFLSAMKAITYLRRAPFEGAVPFYLALAGIAYALLIGLINQSPTEVVVPLLDWVCPVLLGLFVYAQWRDYPTYSKLLRRTFLWIVLICGTYGLYQYVIAPEWDTSWLINSGLTSSGGDPEPYGMRVFSTTHSAAPFSVVMLAGLMLLFSTESPVQFPATAVGYLSFLLTLVRSAWLGWVVGLLVLITSLKPRLQMRLFLVIFAMMLCVVPLTFIEPFGSVIGARLDSFTNLDSDVSYNGRQGIYEENLGKALNSQLGLGLGGTWENVDSAVIDTLLSLGWIGTLLYVGGLIALLFKLYQRSESKADTFASASKAICLSIFFMLLFSSLMLALPGTVLWVFLGMGTAADEFYSAKRKQD
jgi:hypothetical protein